MLWNYIIMALRAAKKHQASSMVNMIGLVTGFTIFAFGFAYARYEQSYDSFFENADRIYIPATGIAETAPVQERVFYASFSGIAAEAVEHVEGIELGSHLIIEEGTLTLGSETFRREFRYTDSDFFNIFNLNFTRGDASSFDTHNDTALLSERAALNLFGSTDVLGETFIHENGTAIEVTGVFRNLPMNSHLSTSANYDAGMDYVLNKRLWESTTDNVLDGNWNGISSNIQSYLLFSEGTDPDLVANELTQLLIDRTDERSRLFFSDIRLRALTQMNLNQWEGDDVSGLGIAQGIGLMILFIATLNSISLNTARWIGRSREIGLRRIVGARRRDIAQQLLLESSLYSLLALILSLPAIWLLMPWVTAVLGRELDFTLMFDATMISFLVGTAIVVALASISYPAYLMSGLSHNISLTRTLNMAHSAAWLRKGLVMVQFTLVTALVLSVIVAAQQSTYLIEQQSEFDVDRTLNLTRIPAEQAKTIGEAVAKLPNVELVSLTSSPPFSGTVSIGMFSTNDPTQDPLAIQRFYVDENYLDMFGIELLAGRNLEGMREGDILTDDEWTAEGEGNLNVMISERAVRQLGFTSAVEAIGETFMWDRRDGNKRLTIVGVLPNLNVGEPGAEQRPAIYVQWPSNYSAIALKFRNEADIDLEAIDAAWKSIAPNAPISVTILANAQADVMAPLHRTRDGFIALAVVAIILAGVGLYAMAAYVATASKKEMGIRKVLGAKTMQLAMRMMMKFSKPVAIALFLGLPLGFIAMQTYLENYVDRIEIGPLLLAASGMTTLVIAWSAVAIHAIRAARIHPAEVLRSE